MAGACRNPRNTGLGLMDRYGCCGQPLRVGIPISEKIKAVYEPFPAVERWEVSCSCVGFGLHCNSRLDIRPARNTRHAGSHPLANNLTNLSRRLHWYDCGGMDLIFVSRFWRTISDRAFLDSSSLLGDRSGVGLSSMVCRGTEVVAEVHKGKGYLTIDWSGPL